MRHFAALAALLLLAGPLAAHTLSVSHVDIDARTRDVTVDIDVPLRDLAFALPLDANADDAITWGELRSMQPLLEARVARTVALRAGGRRCPLHPNGLATRTREGVAHASLQLVGSCDVSAGLDVDFRLLADEEPSHAALVTLRAAEGTRSAVARDGARVAHFASGTGGRLQTFLTFLREGVHHILIGYDHIAFLLSLLLPAALSRNAGRWRPVGSAREALGHTLALVTAFTVAHSVTLSLAALGLVQPAPRPVEIAIAASVLLAALNNVWPLVTRRPWLLAFGFGLVHGFGFAGALGEIGLPPGDNATALFGFNLGVEAGQLAIVAVVLPVLYGIRGVRSYPTRVLPGASLAIAALAAYWIVQRVG
ncbi:HupE/UreJ family protein [Lysobacter xanthus]